ncbi:MAG: hypothetical protein OXR68_01670 [Alphaproteobacteria bacterium]|nr:hypothetical protein [Alphaproteobacteria bacterium]MDD9919320.1 hypothetical protein [Alphaproteobacteria bacterium]
MSDDEDIVGGEDEGEDMGTVVLMLGLYLIVLAFFILMNAISEDSPDRHDLVVESVREGFDFREEGDNKGSDDTDISVIPLYKASSQEIEGVIQTYLSLKDIEVEFQSERLYVSMDLRKFFKVGSEHLIPEMILFFEDLATVLDAPKPGMGVITQVTVKGDETELAADKEISALELSGRRATLFARALIDEGVFKENISAGAALGSPRVLMTFDILVTDYEKAIAEVKTLQDVLENVSDQVSQDKVDVEEAQ